jgi:hypothetical protein
VPDSSCLHSRLAHLWQISHHCKTSHSIALWLQWGKWRIEGWQKFFSCLSFSVFTQKNELEVWSGWKYLQGCICKDEEKISSSSLLLELRTELDSLPSLRWAPTLTKLGSCLIGRVLTHNLSP